MPSTAPLQAPAVHPDRPAFAAFVADELTRAALARMAADKGWPDTHVLRGGAIEAVEILSNAPTPKLIVLDLSDSVDPVLDVNQLANVCDHETRVIALGTTNDIGLFRELIELGVDDYLLKPLSADLLAAAIDKVAQPAAATAEAKAGRLIAVTGARGGAGATSIAVNMAWQIAHEQGRRVALVDLDLRFGTVALMLDLEPGRGFVDALDNPERIDGLFLERTAVRTGENLAVLAADQSLDRECGLGAAAVDLLLGRLRADFDCVVVDAPRGVVLDVPGIVTAADAVVVATDLTLAGMRDALRLVDFVKAKKSYAQVRVVANRVGQTKKAEMPAADFERSIEARIAASLPFDPAAAAKSARLGRPLAAVAPKGRFAVGLRALAREVSGYRPSTKAPLWRRVLGRGT